MKNEISFQIKMKFDINLSVPHIENGLKNAADSIAQGITTGSTHVSSGATSVGVGVTSLGDGARIIGYDQQKKSITVLNHRQTLINQTNNSKKNSRTKSIINMKTGCI
ncbi:unnamed protein product [Adineta ricciae]|uniref:Uncharacterized protein n=1 Tax=Adineta ricciae TaxID=249248 RepID=A0A815VL78_ADIRI|nr:unnamed protein product [Adineta ricciae]